MCVVCWCVFFFLLMFYFLPCQKRLCFTCLLLFWGVSRVRACCGFTPSLLDIGLLCCVPLANYVCCVLVCAFISWICFVFTLSKLFVFCVFTFVLGCFACSYVLYFTLDILFFLRPGIYLSWDHAKPQVHGFSDPVHQKFRTLRAAQKFMRENRLFPPGIRTPFPPAPQTPWPQEEYIYSTTSFTPTIECAPALVWPHTFVPIQQMAERIAADPGNLVLDPPECCDGHCPYSCGPPDAQRFTLMRRLFQLNAQLGRDPDPGSDSDDQKQFAG